MQKLPRLQLVFLAWCSFLHNTFFVVSIAGNLENNLVLASLSILANISPGSRNTAFSLVTLLLSLATFVSYFSWLFSKSQFFFGLAILILVLAFTLKGCTSFWLGFFSLIVRIDTHLQWSFSLGVLLVQINILLSANFGFDPIDFTDQIVSE